MGFAYQNAGLETLATVINDALTTRASVEIPAVAAPCSLAGGEGVDAVDGWRKQSEDCHSPEYQWKTVYTYKRNIRMKLHMDTRFSPFYLCRNQKTDGTKPVRARTVLNYC